MRHHETLRRIAREQRNRADLLEQSLRECVLELRHTNQQLLHEGYNEGMTVTNALAKADAILNP